MLAARLEDERNTEKIHMKTWGKDMTIVSNEKGMQHHTTPHHTTTKDLDTNIEYPYSLKHDK